MVETAIHHMMLNNLCDASTNKDEWINGCSYGEALLKWFWGWYYYNYVRVVQNFECIHRYYDITTKNNHNQIFSSPSTNSHSLWAPISKFWQHGYRNFKFLFLLNCHNCKYFLSPNVGNGIATIQFFFSLYHIMSLSTLLLSLRISAIALPKFASLFIFLNKFEQCPYHK